MAGDDDSNQWGDRGEPKEKSPDDFEEVETQTPAQFRIEQKIGEHKAELVNKIDLEIAKLSGELSKVTKTLRRLHKKGENVAPGSEIGKLLAKHNEIRKQLNALDARKVNLLGENAQLGAMYKEFGANRAKAAVAVAMPISGNGNHLPVKH
ncbi:MAG: hypothetical protein WC717_05450 [Candidatus Micrarchaeia archaeon]|jgi:hypothetical protein